ncbi:MAG: methionyl-tRNA formyltransferase, partial [Candidatus Cloacimonetes bacterium]|nr:methionyl-tRNA formyltransferase [Candidatus Cloacimonadota bacterium]
MKIEKIVFMGTPDFAVPTLNALAKTRFKPQLCITQPDRPKGRKRKLQPTPVKSAAQKLEIPVIQPEDVNSLETINELLEIAPDIIVT